MDNRILEFLEQMGDTTELIEIEDAIASEVPNVNPAPLGGVAERTVLSGDGKRVMKIRRSKLVFTEDGHLIQDPTSLAICGVCKQQGVIRILSKDSARPCAECGKVLCPECQNVVCGQVYCPEHHMSHLLANVVNMFQVRAHRLKSDR